MFSELTKIEMVAQKFDLIRLATPSKIYARGQYKKNPLLLLMILGYSTIVRFITQNYLNFAMNFYSMNDAFQRNMWFLNPSVLN